MNNDNSLRNFNARVDEEIFLRYSNKIKGYMCYNKKLCKMIDCTDVKGDKELPLKNKQLRFISPLDQTNS